MTIDNIIRLAELQDRGDLDPATEEAIALAYADRHAADSRYVAAWARWLHHDGARWNLDSTLHAFNRARALCREAALQCNGSRTVAAVASAKAVAAVVRLAMSDRRLAATVEQWDANPHLLTTTEVDGIAAATYDLTTGIGRAPDPLDYITKATACSAASPGTAHPKWSAFLARITASNEELQDFLQRYIGYCCTGYVTEHAFVFAYGTGANGKSTFINTIVRVLGSYATVADMNTFIASKSERHPTDLAKLCGARLVVAQETQRGRRWDEIKIKALTGGDKLTARFMRQDFFDFTPTFKLFITGNHKPRISSVDEAMRRAPAASPLHRKNSSRRARCRPARKAVGRARGNSALVPRRYLPMAADGPCTAQDRARGHRRVFPAAGHSRIVDRGVHRAERRAVYAPVQSLCFVEILVRGPQPCTGKRPLAVRHPRGPRLRKSPRGAYGPARLQRYYHQTEIVG